MATALNKEFYENVAAFVAARFNSETFSEVFVENFLNSLLESDKINTQPLVATSLVESRQQPAQQPAFSAIQSREQPTIEPTLAFTEPSNRLNSEKSDTKFSTDLSDIKEMFKNAFFGSSSVVKLQKDQSLTDLLQKLTTTTQESAEQNLSQKAKEEDKKEIPFLESLKKDVAAFKSDYQTFKGWFAPKKPGTIVSEKQAEAAKDQKWDGITGLPINKEAQTAYQKLPLEERQKREQSVDANTEEWFAKEMQQTESILNTLKETNVTTSELQKQITKESAIPTVKQPDFNKPLDVNLLNLSPLVEEALQNISPQENVNEIISENNQSLIKEIQTFFENEIVKSNDTTSIKEKLLDNNLAQTTTPENSNVENLLTEIASAIDDSFIGLSQILTEHGKNFDTFQGILTEITKTLGNTLDHQKQRSLLEDEEKAWPVIVEDFGLAAQKFLQTIFPERVQQAIIRTDETALKILDKLDDIIKWLEKIEQSNDGGGGFSPLDFLPTRRRRGPRNRRRGGPKPTPSRSKPGKPTPSRSKPGKPTPSPSKPGKPTPSPSKPGKPTPSPSKPGKPTPSPSKPGKPTAPKPSPKAPTAPKASPGRLIPKGAGGAAKVAGAAGAVVGVGLSAYEIYQINQAEKKGEITPEQAKQMKAGAVGGGAGGLAGGLGGAAAGAALGTMIFPGVGTIIGGIIGGVAGGMAGDYAGRSAGEALYAPAEEGTLAETSASVEAPQQAVPPASSPMPQPNPDVVPISPDTQVPDVEKPKQSIQVPRPGAWPATDVEKPKQSIQVPRPGAWPATDVEKPKQSIPVVPSSPSRDTVTSSKVSPQVEVAKEESKIDNNLLKVIATNTQGTNAGLETLADAFNSFVRSFDKFGNKVGEKMNTEPAIVNLGQQSGGGASPVRASEIARAGFKGISDLRAFHEAARPIPT